MVPRWRKAYRALCGGDVKPWAAIWSTHDPVSLFGAAGSASGIEEVRRVQDWVAGHFAGLVDEKQELIAAGGVRRPRLHRRLRAQDRRHPGR